MRVDLKNMEGEPRDVAAEAVLQLLADHATYAASLNEASKWVRNAKMTEALTENEDADPNGVWKDSWEGRIFSLLKTKAVSHRGILKRLQEIVDTYEGYDE